MATELKVGLLVIAAFVAAIVMIIRLQQNGVRLDDAIRYHTLAEDVTGLPANAGVKVAGIDVGRVTGIQLEDDKARIEIGIDRRVTVRENATIRLRRIGYLGDKYVSLDLGTPESPRLEPGSAISLAGDAVDLDALAERSVELSENLSSLLGALDPDELRAMIRSLRSSSQNLESITGAIRDGEGTVGELVYEDGMVDQIQTALSSVNRAMTRVEDTRIDFGARAFSAPATSSLRSDFGIHVLPPSPNQILFGATYRTRPVGPGADPDNPELALNAQFARRFSNFALRLGIFESTGGIGWEYAPAPRVRVYGEVYRFGTGDAPQLNLGLEVPLFGPLGAWAGGDYLTRELDRSLFLGVGLRWSLLDLGAGDD